MLRASVSNVVIFAVKNRMEISLGVAIGEPYRIVAIRVNQA
jgi:hypothetical protein